MLPKKLWSQCVEVLPIRYLFLPVVWIIAIGFSHYHLNYESADRAVIRMGYMPVITNFAAPILDYASKDTKDIRFKALKFSSFAEMAESIRNDHIDVAFMIAPLSIVLRQQGVDIKVVLIGNRHESSFVTRSDLNIQDFSQLEGKTIAVPMRYSGHNLSALKLIKQHNMGGNVEIVEMNPPDMASALASGSLDAYYVGEPFAAKTLKSGDASLLFYVEDVWPGFICNLVIVKNSYIERHPERVKKFVESAVRAGQWVSNNKQAAAAIASGYWNTSADLISYAMNTPENRIIYDRYIPKAEQLQEIASIMYEFNLAENDVIGNLVDDSFARNASLENVVDINSIITQ